MRPESPEEKFNRLRGVLQNLWLKAYPNPDRIGCPGTPALEGYAQRVAAWEKLDGDPIEVHVQHCSPCYREFLDTRERLRAETPAAPAKKMSWFRRRRLGKTLDQLEGVMKSVDDEVRKKRWHAS
jgi:hypothetical protein